MAIDYRKALTLPQLGAMLEILDNPKDGIISSDKVIESLIRRDLATCKLDGLGRPQNGWKGLKLTPFGRQVAEMHLIKEERRRIALTLLEQVNQLGVDAEII